MDTQHKIVSHIKNLAADLNRKPTLAEFLASKEITRHQLFKTFPTWRTALNAAGFVAETKKEKRKRIADVFDAEINEPVLKLVPRSAVPDCALSMPGFKTTAILGDMHLPWCNANTLTAFYAFLKLYRHKIKRVVQCGDIFDLFAHAKFSRSRHTYNPYEEITLARKMAIEFWTKVQEIIPGVECYQLLGNHDVRPFKRVLENYPEGEIFFQFDQYYKFNGVQTVFDYRDPLILDGIYFHHFFLSGIGKHRDHFMANAVGGHTHTGGVSFKKIHDKILWELNVGYCGDETSKALSYTATKVTKWTQGWGYIDEWGPRFIPA